MPRFLQYYKSKLTSELSPTDAWVPCQFRAEASPSSCDWPEGPDDYLAGLAFIALEDVALNVELSGNLRREARIMQFVLSPMEWDDVLGDLHLSRFVLFALKLWEEQDPFGGGLSIAKMGDVRSMMSDLNCALVNDGG